MSISVPPPCEPIVIQRQSPLPLESMRIGILVFFYELSHHTLGQGAQQGFVQVDSRNVLLLQMGHPIFKIVYLQVCFLLFYPMSSLPLTDHNAVPRMTIGWSTPQCS